LISGGAENGQTRWRWLESPPKIDDEQLCPKAMNRPKIYLVGSTYMLDTRLFPVRIARAETIF
jgi:hypothetical protein